MLVPSIQINLPISPAFTETARRSEQGHDNLCPVLQMAAIPAEILIDQRGGFCAVGGKCRCNPRRDQCRNDWKAVAVGIHCTRLLLFIYLSFRSTHGTLFRPACPVAEVSRRSTPFGQTKPEKEVPTALASNMTRGRISCRSLFASRLRHILLVSESTAVKISAGQVRVRSPLSYMYVPVHVCSSCFPPDVFVREKLSPFDLRAFWSTSVRRQPLVFTC